MSDLTWDYSNDAGRLRAARDLYKRFCEHLHDDPARAKLQLIAGIQSALGQAYMQGVADHYSPRG